MYHTGAGAGNPDKFELLRASHGSEGEEVRACIWATMHDSDTWVCTFATYSSLHVHVYRNEKHTLALNLLLFNLSLYIDMHPRTNDALCMRCF